MAETAEERRERLKKVARLSLLTAQSKALNYRFVSTLILDFCGRKAQVQELPTRGSFRGLGAPIFADVRRMPISPPPLYQDKELKTKAVAAELPKPILDEGLRKLRIGLL